MDTSSPVDQAFIAVIDVLVREFESTRRDSDAVTPATNADAYLALAQQKFVSALKDRLAEVESPDASASEAAGDQLPATIDTPISKAPGDGTKKQSPADSKYVETTVSIGQEPDRRATIRSRTPPQVKPDAHAPADYEVLGRLGKGGMGIVYKARHVPLNRIVAIKMILAGKHALPDALARFRQEAEAAAHLTHPNIVSVYEVGEYEGMPYFSSEYVDGLAMSELLSEASLSSKRSAELMEQVSRAVHYSHQQGVVHRDLKPSNILITGDGDPKVADFGLAKRLDDEDQDQTRTGQILGTPGFMSPEQARGEKSIGPSTDVYALGAILYNMLTGRAPFVGPTPVETIQQVVSEDPVRPSRLQPGLDRDLETICMKCLEKEPDRRYASAADLADELQRVHEGKPIVARPITNRERLIKWCRRNPRVATLSGIAASLLLLMMSGGYVAAGVINQQKIAETEARELAEEKEALAEDQAELAVNATNLVVHQTQKYFKYRPGLNELRQNMLEGILTEIERIYEQKLSFDVRGSFHASALKQLGQIYFEAGEFEKALEYFSESESIAIKLHQEGRLSRPELNFSILDFRIGDTYVRLGKLDLAEQRFSSMIEHRENYFATESGINATMAEQSMAEAYGRLGEVFLLQRKLEQAKPLLRQSTDARRNWYEANPRNLRTGEELSGALRSLSQLYEQTGEFPEMITAAEQAVALSRDLAANNSELATHYNLAEALRQLGDQYDRLAGDQNSAESRLRESIVQYEAALQESPGFRSAQVRAADSYYRLAKLLLRSKRDHREQCKRGIELCDQLLAKAPSVTHDRLLKLKLVALSGQVEEATRLADQFAGDHRVSALSQLGKTCLEAQDFKRALELFSESESIAVNANEDGGLSQPELHVEPLDLWIGDAHLQLGDLNLAEQRYRNLIEHRKKYFAAHTEISSAMAEHRMAEANGRLGEVLRLQGRLGQAKPLLQASIDTRREWCSAHPRDLRTGEELSGTLRGLSRLYQKTGDFPEMIAAAEEAAKLLRNSAANKSDFPSFYNLADTLRQLGDQYPLVGEREKAESCLRESVNQYEAALKKIPGYRPAWVGAADSYYRLAQLLFRSGKDHSEQCKRGIALCDQLLAESPSVVDRVVKLKLVALSGQVEEASKLADELAGDRKDPDKCLYGAIGYALASDYCDNPQKQELVDKALECVREALKLGFSHFGVLRTDPDFETLQKLDAYQKLLDEAEGK